MMGRAIFSRHRRYGFYRPSAVTIAMTVADAPNNAAQILVFCVSIAGCVRATVLTLILCLQIISYFMGGLYRSAGAFFSVRCLSGRPYSAADVSLRN